jgi:hypothetical protein
MAKLRHQVLNHHVFHTNLVIFMHSACIVIIKESLGVERWITVESVHNKISLVGHLNSSLRHNTTVYMTISHNIGADKKNSSHTVTVHQPTSLLSSSKNFNGQVQLNCM